MVSEGYYVLILWCYWNMPVATFEIQSRKQMAGGRSLLPWRIKLTVIDAECRRSRYDLSFWGSNVTGAAHGDVEIWITPAFIISLTTFLVQRCVQWALSLMGQQTWGLMVRVIRLQKPGNQGWKGPRQKTSVSPITGRGVSPSLHTRPDGQSNEWSGTPVSSRVWTCSPAIFSYIQNGDSTAISGPLKPYVVWLDTEKHSRNGLPLCSMCRFSGRLFRKSRQFFVGAVVGVQAHRPWRICVPGLQYCLRSLLCSKVLTHLSAGSCAGVLLVHAGL